MRARFQNLTKVLRHRFWCSNGDFLSLFVKFSSKTLNFVSKIVFPTKKPSAIFYLKFLLIYHITNFFNLSLLRLCRWLRVQYWKRLNSDNRRYHQPNFWQNLQQNNKIGMIFMVLKTINYWLNLTKKCSSNFPQPTTTMELVPTKGHSFSSACQSAL